MKCIVDNERLIIDEDERTFSFDAHGEAPHPSLMGMGISARGVSTGRTETPKRSFQSTQVFNTLPVVRDILPGTHKILSPTEWITRSQRMGKLSGECAKRVRTGFIVFATPHISLRW